MRSSSMKWTKQRIMAEYGFKAADKAVENLSLFSKSMKPLSHCIAEKNIARRITDLTLNIVNSCNLKCRYCWNEGGSYGNFLDKSQMMDEITAINAVDILLKESSGSKDLVVDFYGGEPLLNFELIKKVVIYCKKIQNEKKTNFRFLLATNGTLLSKERGEFLIKNGVDIAVSLDGPRQIHDMHRPFLGGRGGSFDVIMSNINSLSREYREKIVGRATFTPYSTMLVRIFRFLRNRGFNRIELCESEKAGYGLDSKSDFFFSGEDGIRKLKKLYYNLAIFYSQEVSKGRLTYENTYFNRFFKQLSRLYNIHSVDDCCSAGKNLMSVDIDGSIYPCTAFIGRKQFRIGKVNTGIDKNKIRSFLGVKICSCDVCNMCWAKKLCQGCGSCYNLNFFSNNSLERPDHFYCEIFRYKTKLMIAMIAEIGERSPELLDKLLIPEYYTVRGKIKNN